MKRNESALKDAVFAGYKSMADGKKAYRGETPFEQGRSYGQKHVKAPLTVPFTILDDTAEVSKKMGGELGRRQGERLADFKANANAVLGGKAAAKKRVAELQTAPLSDSVKVGMDFGVGYALAAGETLFDIYAQNCDRGIMVINRNIEAAGKVFGVPVVKLPTVIDYGKEFIELIIKGDKKGMKELYEMNGKEIEEAVPGAGEFVEYMLENKE